MFFMLEYKNKQQNYLTCLKNSSTTISLDFGGYNIFTKNTLNKYTISSNISNYSCRQRQIQICLPQVFSQRISNGTFLHCASRLDEN